MTNTPSDMDRSPEPDRNPDPAPGPIDMDSASIDELERMLADAERHIHAIHEKIAERRAELLSRQFDALPDDISVFEGSWRAIIKVLRDATKRP